MHRIWPTAAFILSLAGAAALAEPAVDPATPQAIATWIEQLDSDVFFVREQASEKLMHAGIAALEPLAEAADSSVAEVASRAARILLQFSEHPDAKIAMEALRHLAGLKRRSWERDTAIGVLARMREEKALAELIRLGGIIRGEYQSRGTTTVAHLHLGETYRGGDEGLRYVNDLRSLQTLSIYHVPVTDSGLAQLRGPRTLLLVQLFGTEVTEQGVRALKATFPDVTVKYGRGAFLGVRGVEPPAPARVLVVVRGSAAEAAGILRGDVIAAVDGQAVKDFEQLQKLIGKHRSGEKAVLELVRNGQRITKEVLFGKWQ